MAAILRIDTDRASAAHSSGVGRRRRQRRGYAAVYCYHYDPMTGRYGIAIMRTLRIAGRPRVLLGTFVVVMLRREKKGAGASHVSGTRCPRGCVDDGRA